MKLKVKKTKPTSLMVGMALTALASGALIADRAMAWDGYDTNTGDSVEIEGGNLMRMGEEIEIYDFSTGGSHSAEVLEIERIGSSVSIEIFDNETGDYRTLEMED